MKSKKAVLVILDGWGVARPSPGNAITLANTPTYDYLLKSYPSCLVKASGREVGLPWGEVGNSEVGHMTLGLGRVVDQDLSQINRKIKDHSLFKQKALTDLIKIGAKIHLVGLVSDGGVHSHIDHLLALIEWLKDNFRGKVFIHAILDGRDSPEKSAKRYLSQIEKVISLNPQFTIADLSGRYFAMDRDKRWERTEAAYRVMTEINNNRRSWQQALEEAYQKNESDEFVKPVSLVADGAIKDGDGVLFFNYRPDRMIQLVKAFVDPNFDSFSRVPLKKSVATMTNYEDNLPVTEVLSSLELANPKTNPLDQGLGELVSRQQSKQLRLAETEKFAHVTYFFSGGKHEPLAGEKRDLVPSPRVATYDLKPEMSASEIVSRFKSAIKQDYDLIVINFANADMVGHTGKINPTKIAVETVDRSLGEVVKAGSEANYQLAIVADHGNAEQMISPTGQADKEHTVNPVPLIVVSETVGMAKIAKSKIDLAGIEPVGLIADVAPTLGKLMGIAVSKEMTGASLVSSLK